MDVLATVATLVIFVLLFWGRQLIERAYRDDL